MGTRGDAAGDSQRAIPGALLGITVMAGEKKKKKQQRAGQRGIGAVFKFYPGGQSGFGATTWVWGECFAIQIAWRAACQRAFLEEK